MEPTEDGPASEGRRRAVLVVEDFASIGGLVAGLLRESGYRVMRAWGAQEALRLARERRPDLVLLDLNAPNEGAASTLRSLATGEATRDCPLVVVTAPGLTLDDEERAWPTEMVAKPFDIDVMLNAVRKALGEPTVDVPPRAWTQQQDHWLNGY